MEKKGNYFLEIINELKTKTWNPNTIRTLIKRLHTKKAIRVSRTEGKTYFYIPIIQEEQYKKTASKNLIDKLFNGSLEDFILSFSKD